MFDKFISAWASYADGTPSDAVNMILDSLAKKYPEEYVQKFDQATKKVEKKNGPPPAKLPADFVSYDGTNDIGWNSSYGKLIKYKEENGDCKVHTKQSSLGEWVCRQRSLKNHNSKVMT